jgi:geranylgeranyl diphosphate synthase type I
MSFTEQLRAFILEFDPTYLEYLDRQIISGRTINHQAEKNLIEIKKLVAAGGKRLRPALAWAGAALFGLENQKEVWNLGIALDLFHTFALIHDDIIDEADTRRGHPTMEASYRQYFSGIFGEVRSRNHFAASAAILGGDFALVLADQIVGKLNNSLVRDMYHQMQFELVAGQLDDCFGVGLADLDELQEDQVLKMLKNKSGNYSIQKPLLMGALFNSKPSDQDSWDIVKANKQLSSLADIGEKIGLVFQITDDILGVFGDEDETGKSNLSDIVEGKKTLLMLRTYSKLSNVEKLRVRNILGQKDYKIEEIQWLKDKIIGTGTLSEMQTLCQKLNYEVDQELTQKFDSNNPGVDFIRGLSEYLLTRKK